jgi:hypothetical protein
LLRRVLRRIEQPVPPHNSQLDVTGVHHIAQRKEITKETPAEKPHERHRSRHDRERDGQS